MTTPQPPIDRTAAASTGIALIGAGAWPLVGGWAAMLAATVSLPLGLVALSRLKRNAKAGRWAAIVGIAFGVMMYALLIVTVARDLINPIQIYQ